MKKEISSSQVKSVRTVARAASYSLSLRERVRVRGFSGRCTGGVQTRPRSFPGDNTWAARPAGFTIIELAVSTAIALVVSLVVIRFWMTTSEAFSLDTNIVTVKQQSERALEIIVERIQRARAATIVVSNGNRTIDFIDSSDGSAVQFTLQPAAPAAPQWGQIVQTIDGTQATIASYVESLQFSLSGVGLVDITASFHKGTLRQETTLTVQSSAAARI
jgi:hypothetical protein